MIHTKYNDINIHFFHAQNVQPTEYGIHNLSTGPHKINLDGLLTMVGNY